MISNPYLFTGREYDGEIDLYYYRARYYDYQRGRFIQADPLGYVDGPNTYTYSKNNPINLVDASGTTVKACYTKIVPLFPINHKYVRVKSRKTKFNGSWGFDYFPKNKETLGKVLAGEIVQGQIRKNEHEYQHPNKPKCYTVAVGTNYDYCIYSAAKRKLALPPPPYELFPGHNGISGTENCITWSNKLLWECGIYNPGKNAAISGGSYNSVSMMTANGDSDTSK